MKYRKLSEMVLTRPAAMFLVLLVLGLAVWALGLRHYADPKDVSDAAAALAIIVGGAWTLYQFVLRRAFETSLQIEVAVRTNAFGEGKYIVYLQVTLTNSGARRITVPPVMSNAQIEDYEKSVRYPVDLQIKMVNERAKVPSFLGWWSAGKLNTIEGIPEHISLLYEYSFSDGTIDFFMESGEKYQVGSTFLLPAGHYVAKIVFVGERATAAEFWSRIFHFCVPSAPDNSRST